MLKRKSLERSFPNGFQVGATRRVAPTGKRQRRAADSRSPLWKVGLFLQRFVRFLPGRYRFSIPAAGLAAILFMLALAVGGLNTAHNPFYLLTGLLLGMLGFQWFASGAMLKGIEVARRHPSTVFAGESFRVSLILKNRKRLLTSLSLDLQERRVRREPPVRLSCLAVPPKESLVLNYNMVIERRGLYRFRGITLSTGFPFGFIIRKKYFPLRSEMLVFPKLGRVRLTLAKTRPAFEIRPGKRGRAFTRVFEEEFHGLREFRPGDNPRDIHWKSSAKWNVPLVKEYESAEEPRVVIFLDTFLGRDGVYRGKTRSQLLEKGISFAASLSRDLVGKGYEVTLAAFGPELEVRRNVCDRGDLLKIYRTLALLEGTTESRMGRLVEESRPHVSPCGLRIYVVLKEEDGDFLVRVESRDRIIPVDSELFCRIFEVDTPPSRNP